MTEVKVLGVIFSVVGKKVDPEKVKAIQEFGAIDTLKKAQCTALLQWVRAPLCFVTESKRTKIHSYKRSYGRLSINQRLHFSNMHALPPKL